MPLTCRASCDPLGHSSSPKGHDERHSKTPRNFRSRRTPKRPEKLEVLHPGHQKLAAPRIYPPTSGRLGVSSIHFGLSLFVQLFFNVCVLRISFFGGLAALSFLGSFRIFPDGHETLLPSDFGRCSLLSSFALGSRGCFLEWPEIGSGGCCKSAEVGLVSSSFVWKVSFFHHTSVAVLLAALLLYSL